MFALAFLLILSCVQVVPANIEASSVRQFEHIKISRTKRNIHSCGVDFVFGKFGSNNGINRTQLNTLMKQLSIGNDTSAGLSNCIKCLAADDVLTQNGLKSTHILNRTSFETVCPSLLQQIISKSCQSKHAHKETHHTSKTKVSTAEAWGYGLLSVTIISMASMLGAFVVPFMNKAFYKKLLLFMVSLAVGVLGGSGIFHLIPHAFGLGHNHGSGHSEHSDHASSGGNETENRAHLWKSCVIVGGIYFFFITENLMKIYIRFSEWKKKASPDCKAMVVDANINSLKTTDIDHCHIVLNDSDVHKNHALDSVHVTDKNCQHEHGVDTLNVAGDHGINEKSMNVMFSDDESRKVGFFERVAPVAWMIILGDGLHNFIDGLAIGVSFTSNILQGVSTSIAIICEELPHELGDFAILLNSGFTYKQAILANFLSACTCYAGLIAGIILGTKTDSVQWVYALAAGMFLYISLVDMLPEATGMQVTISATSKKETWLNFFIVNMGIIIGFVIMLVLALYGEGIKI
eukprot:Seg1218.7 transcript_id=Seg1218.7/GoldUCD/mRNA.D3Y31 product="Zinc transporter ZIP14" protein_id=Seg1218.7/GoldUCD/D3Y31